jgi:hypothetical protein
LGSSEKFAHRFLDDTPGQDQGFFRDGDGKPTFMDFINPLDSFAGELPPLAIADHLRAIFPGGFLDSLQQLATVLIQWDFDASAHENASDGFLTG